MAIWHNTTNNSIHDDNGGNAISLPSWPQGMVQITQAEADALLAPTPEQAAVIAAQAAQAAQDAADTLASKQYTKLQALSKMTPAQVQSWVAANVTNLAQAQDAITTLAIAVSILARRL